MKQARTRRKCFSRDTEACPGPRSPALCTRWSGATCCVTPPLTPPRHATRPWTTLSLLVCASTAYQAKGLLVKPRTQHVAFLMTLERSKVVFRSTVYHILEKWNSCRSFYLLYCFCSLITAHIKYGHCVSMRKQIFYTPISTASNKTL